MIINNWYKYIGWYNIPEKNVNFGMIPNINVINQQLFRLIQNYDLVELEWMAIQSPKKNNYSNYIQKQIDYMKSLILSDY